jgi:hypothetical protein
MCKSVPVDSCTNIPRSILLGQRLADRHGSGSGSGNGNGQVGTSRGF